MIKLIKIISQVYKTIKKWKINNQKIWKLNKMILIIKMIKN